ncbi:unnamed protein product [Rhodiola kirilowii]
MKRCSKRKPRQGVATATDDKNHVSVVDLGSLIKISEGDKVIRTSARISYYAAKTVENPPQQPLETLDVNSSDRKYIKVLKRLPRPGKALGSCSPKSSVTACHDCRQIEKTHKWCLRSLKCGSTLASGCPSVASVDVRVPEPVSGVSMHGPGQIRVQDSPMTRTVPPTSSRPTKSATSRNLNKPSATTARLLNLSAQSPHDMTTYASTAPSHLLATDTAVGPELHRPSDKVVCLKLLASLSSISPLVYARANVPLQAQIYYDPFSSMRLDIDNMSYEELLALQERIGYVSTGLSEEELAKSRKIATYRVKRRKTTKHKEVDSRCSICQEEFQTGEKMGSLKCKHSYHVLCIDQWLRQKNWCPTCKAGAAAYGT